jgi:hypothetical protein
VLHAVGFAHKLLLRSDDVWYLKFSLTFPSTCIRKKSLMCIISWTDFSVLKSAVKTIPKRPLKITPIWFLAASIKNKDSGTWGYLFLSLINCSELFYWVWCQRPGADTIPSRLEPLPKLYTCLWRLAKRKPETCKAEVNRQIDNKLKTCALRWSLYKFKDFHVCSSIKVPALYNCYNYKSHKQLKRFFEILILGPFLLH